MSLLLDALKRAEQEKLTRQGDRAPEEPSPRPSPLAAAAASAPPTLELQPIGPAANASAGGPRADAHAAAQAIFQAKADGTAPRNRGTLLAIAGAIAVVVLAASAYVWMQVQALQPRAPTVARARPAPIAPPAADLNAPRPESMSLPATFAQSAASAPAPTTATTSTSSTTPASGLSPSAPNGSAAPSTSAPPSPLAALLDNARADASPPLRLERTVDKPRVPEELNAGYAALVAGDLDAARRQYGAALARDPVSLDAQLGMATVEAREGRRAAAAARYRRALELDPHNATALAGLASLADMSRPEALETQLRADLSQYPNSAALHMALGNLYAAQKRWSEAQDAFFEAHRLEPENADVLFNLAVSLDHLGQVKLAAEFYRRALDSSRARPTQFDPAPAARRLAELHR